MEILRQQAAASHSSTRPFVLLLYDWLLVACTAVPRRDRPINQRIAHSSVKRSAHGCVFGPHVCVKSQVQRGGAIDEWGHPAPSLVRCLSEQEPDARTLNNHCKPSTSVPFACLEKLGAAAGPKPKPRPSNQPVLPFFLFLKASMIQAVANSRMITATLKSSSRQEVLFPYAGKPGLPFAVRGPPGPRPCLGPMSDLHVQSAVSVPASDHV